MAQHASYAKTIVLALVVAVIGVVGLVAFDWTALPGILGVLLRLLVMLGVIGSLLVTGGGLVCLWRDRLIDQGRRDPIGASLNRVPAPGPLARLGLRALLGRAPRPGDMVMVRPLAEIRSTLDEESSLDGLPFMPEMHRYCGRTFRVHRRVDKIYDMRHKTGMRRLRGTVSLTAVRCTGDHHGGCQAGCQLLWKDAWLRRVPSAAPAGVGVPSALRSSPDATTREPDSYVCQMTRLWEATSVMSRFDLRQDLRPLLSGNVQPGVYLIVMLTRLFNKVQQARGGVDYPSLPGRPADQPVAATPPHEVVEGQVVQVGDRWQISRTLTNGRNKGLWYDRDMVRYCGNTAVAKQRVTQLIHEGTGRMLKLKTSAWILDDLTATGEFHRLCPQNENILWREAWLRPSGASGDRAGSGGRD